MITQKPDPLSHNEEHIRRLVNLLDRAKDDLSSGNFSTENMQAVTEWLSYFGSKPPDNIPGDIEYYLGIYVAGDQARIWVEPQPNQSESQYIAGTDHILEIFHLMASGKMAEDMKKYFTNVAAARDTFKADAIQFCQSLAHHYRVIYGI